MRSELLILDIQANHRPLWLIPKTLIRDTEK